MNLTETHGDYIDDLETDLFSNRKIKISIIQIYIILLFHFKTPHYGFNSLLCYTGHNRVRMAKISILK